MKPPNVLLGLRYSVFHHYMVLVEAGVFRFQGLYSAHQNYSALLFIFLSGVNAQKKNIHHLFWKPLFFTTKNISLSQ